MIKTKKFKGCFYHQTSRWAAESILKNGFYIEQGGNQRFTEGIYLNSHPHGDYGDSCLMVCVDGVFIDLSKDILGNDWLKLKHRNWEGSYTSLTNNIKKEFPKADGIIFNGILVLWKPKRITKIKLHKQY